MDPFITVNVNAVASGFAVGTLVGLTEVGGGSLMTPLLMGVFKLHPAVAIGTDLWFAALTQAGGRWAHHRRGHVDGRITGWLLPGIWLGAQLTRALPERLVRSVLCLSLVGAGFKLLS